MIRKWNFVCIRIEDAIMFLSQRKRVCNVASGVIELDIWLPRLSRYVVNAIRLRLQDRPSYSRKLSAESSTQQMQVVAFICKSHAMKYDTSSARKKRTRKQCFTPGYRKIFLTCSILHYSNSINNYKHTNSFRFKCQTLFSSVKK